MQTSNNQQTKRRLEIATAFLLGIGGAALATETTSYLWMAFGGVMSLVSVIRLSSL